VLGVHNRANALAAAVAAVSRASAERHCRGLRTFGGLEHRLEVVAETDGVLWINDSKATNVGSTDVALRSMDRPVVLLLGGRHKGESYTALLDRPCNRVRRHRVR
jgi:UDP-N-acetylmuramoylalanine--D-glutamate ligase